MRQDKKASVLAVIRVDNGDCGSRADEIRSLVRPLPGINDIRVDTIRQRLLVLYNGDRTALDRILLAIRDLNLAVTLFPVS